ncbi:Caffeic acid 3-O-methyltransferase [Morus notabilis]|uniref:Caffeic acid 3-O-methyltransferase n=1 Tax=Morus notabilis TaxID=981085 RepID=W9RXZ8_9ROSA|nr:Caffeic acid 3-O-methyltransferase [Morus notabilis]
MNSMENEMRNSIEEDEKSSQYAMQLASASVLPMAMKAAALELGVLEIIKKAGPGALLSASQVASELKAQNRDASLVLDRLLSAHSVLTCSVSHSQSDGKALRLHGLSPVF